MEPSFNPVGSTNNLRLSLHFRFPVEKIRESWQRDAPLVVAGWGVMETSTLRQRCVVMAAEQTRTSVPAEK